MNQFRYDGGTMLTLQKIDIRKRSRTCVACEELFIAGDPYYSFLNLIYERRDFCKKCWSEPTSGDVITHWKALVPTKEEKVELSRDRDERAWQLFQIAMEEKNEEEAFILSLYLARKRIIVSRQEVTEKGGTIFILYEVLATEEMLTVQKFPLASLEVNALQLDLAKKFSLHHG